MFTALHRELGRTPSDFSFDMLDDAVAQGLTEGVDLEWKQQLPDQNRPNWRAELAKDFAAMANAGGGIFVYGIREDRGTSAAKELVDVGEIGQILERELRKIAFSLVQPGISGFETYLLRSSDDARRALVVRVAPSAQAPHIVRHENSPHYLAAPVRRGRDTYWLTETEIESAYRARFRAAGDRLRTLDDAFRFEVESLEAWTSPKAVWLTAVAHPVEPRSLLLPQPTSSDASNCLMAGQDLYARIIEGQGAAQFYDLNVRPGRRRWSANRSSDERRFEHIGLDGSVVVSQWVGESMVHEAVSIMGVGSYDVERAAGYAVSTIAGVARTLALNGPHLVQVGVHRRNEALPIRFGGHSRVRDEPAFTGVPVLLAQVQPEVVEMNGFDDDSGLRASMAEMTTLMTSQGGVVDLGLTRPRKTVT